VTLFSEGAETLLGYRAEEVVGRSVAPLYGGEAGAHEVLREMHKRGGTVSGFEGMLWAKYQTAIPVLISASLLFDDDRQQIETVGFATDLRERKRGEEAVQKSYDELEKRVEERTLELREARGRLQYLLTVTPGKGTGQFLSGHFRPQEDRGRAEAPRRRSRTAQSLHPRDIWALSHRRSRRPLLASPAGLKIGGEKRRPCLSDSEPA
jgi:PAS domain S-box-containing protein